MYGTFKSDENATRFEESHRLINDHLSIDFRHLVNDVSVLDQIERLRLEVSRLGVVLIEQYVVTWSRFLPHVAKPSRRYVNILDFSEIIQ